MATFTANYNLRKPGVGDNVTVSTDISANMDIIDSALDDHDDRLDVLEADPVYLFMQKTPDELVTNSTTKQNDNNFGYTFPETGAYVLDFMLLVTGADAGDISFDYAWTGSLTLSGYSQGLQSGGTTLSDFSRIQTTQNLNSSPVSDGPFGTLTGSTVIVDIHLVAVVTAVGTFNLKWAQGTANATATTVKAGSTMEVRKVS